MVKATSWSSGNIGSVPRHAYRRLYRHVYRHVYMGVRIDMCVVSVGLRSRQVYAAWQVAETGLRSMAGT